MYNFAIKMYVMYFYVFNVFLCIHFFLKKQQQYYIKKNLMHFMP